jgi:hypothetical protein
MTVWLPVWAGLIGFSLVLWGVLVTRLVRKARRLKAQVESMLSGLD